MTLALNADTPDTTDETLPVTEDVTTAPAMPDVEDSPTGDTPDAEDPGQPTTPAEDGSAPPAPPQSSADAPAPEPFVLKAHGKTTKLDGAVVVPGEGLRIPEGPAMQRAQQLMARGVEMETYGRQKIRELELTAAELAEDRSAAEVAGQAIVSWFEELRRDPEQLIQAVEQWDRFGPMFDARVEKAQFEQEKRRMARQQQANQPSPQEQYQQILEAAKQEGEAMLQELATQYGLTAPDTQAIAARLLRRPELYLLQTPQGILFDDTTFAADVAAEADDRKARRTQVSAVQQAAAQNAKVAAGTIPVTAKAPANQVTPAQPRDAATGKFKTKEEWEAAMTPG